MVLLIFAILGSLAPLRTIAQTETTGAVAGTLRDQSGAVLPGIVVKITLKTGGAAREVLSNETGNYFAGLLAPGLYTVRAELHPREKRGFSVEQPGYTEYTRRPYPGSQHHRVVQPGTRL